LRKLLFGSGLTAVGCGAYAATRPKPAPFHVEYPPLKIRVPGCEDAFPYLHFIMSNIPEKMRRSLVVKLGAPKGNELKDRYDCVGESPYSIKELVPDRLWRITYECGISNMISDEGKQQGKAFGMDPDDPAYEGRVLAGASQYGERAVEVAREDIVKAREVWAKESYTDEELVKFSVWSLNSFIVKLSGDRLLLYAPVKIREETGFAQWVDSLGQVEWIVIASGAHTLNIQPVVARYPEAKVIGPPQAEAKLNHVSALPRRKFDFDSTRQEDLAAVNDLLRAEGVRLHDVAGDVVTNALVAVCDEKHLMECDLIYTHADGDGFLTIDKERFRKFLPEDWFFRLFRYNTMALPNSPAGYLPAYRYQLMDPNCLGVMLYDQPAFDGSSCRLMARSLREVVEAKFDVAYGVHFDEMRGESFREAMDKNWNWLDGKPLV